MITKQEEDTLMTAFDALDADLGKLLAHYRKLKRDRNALLEAGKALAVLDDGDESFAWKHQDEFSKLHAAIAQAEIEEE